MTHVFSLVCLTLATTSCGWVKLHADKYEIAKDPEKQLFSEKRFLDAEQARYKHPSGQPQFCVALSGGGIRSAAYSIGVLKGLHVIKRQVPDKLPDVDIISAVSGGSYAATWFYDQYAQKASSETRGLSRMDRLNEVLSETSIRNVAGNVKHFNSFLELVMAGRIIDTNKGFIEAILTGDWNTAIIERLAKLFKPNFPPW